jgi:hypothetical protein
MSGVADLVKLQNDHFIAMRQLATRNLSPMVKKMEMRRLNQQFLANQAELVKRIRMQTPAPTPAPISEPVAEPQAEPVAEPQAEPVDETEAEADDRAIISSLSSQLDTIQISISDKAIARQPMKRALLIGCNYMGTDYRLQGCINDVNNLKSRLISAYGFEEANVVMLTDQTATKPTKATILSEFTRFLQTSVDGDVLVFQFSGHGTYTFDRNGDEADGRDEMIVALDLQNIVDDDLSTIVQTHLKANVTLYAFFDSCHSGTVLDLQYQVLDSTKNNQATFNPKAKAVNGNVFMLSGCMDQQTSADANINRQAQGAMTWAFLNVTNGLAKKKQTWSHVLPAMRAALRQNGYTQVPQLSSSKPIRFSDRLALLG